MGTEQFDKNEHKLLKEFKRYFPLLIIFVFLLFIAFWWGGSGLSHSWDMWKNIRLVNEDVDSLNSIIEMRIDRVEDLKPGGDSLALEHEARIRYNMIKPDEEMFILQPDDKGKRREKKSSKP